MTPANCKKLENLFEFKNRYFKRTDFWKNILFIAPTGFLFAGLVGIIYLVKNEMLVSWYVIPYLVLFTIGTVLLKSVRLHIRKTAMAVDDAYRVCLAKEIGDAEGYIYCIFTKDGKRHNSNLLNNIAKEIDAESLISENLKPARKESIALFSTEQNVDYYLRAYSKNALKKQNAGWNTKDYFPLLYVNKKYTFIVKGKDLRYYL